MADRDRSDDPKQVRVAAREQFREAVRITSELTELSDGTDPFVAAVRITRMPMIITNPRQPDNPVVFVNDAFCRLTGYSREECIGRNCRFMQGPETDRETIARMRVAIAAAEPIEVDIRNYRKDGTAFWNRLLIAPVHDHDGSVAYFFASQFDVTPERESLAERTRELADANRRLRAEAAERARVEDALRHSLKLEALGQLTGGIAHDFNNMLQAVGSSLELIQRHHDQGRPEQALGYLPSARATIGRAAALTNRLLAYGRRQALQPRAVMLDALVRGMLDSIRRTVGAGIEVDLLVRDAGSVALCDPAQLESALLNSAVNARDAMPQGGRLVITIRDAQLSEEDVAGQDGAAPGAYVEIAMTDTGTGMDEATRTRAFEPFFTTKPIGKGTGLGLSQLYGFVRQSNGVAVLDSAPGQGTTVRLCLPRIGQGVAAVPPPSAASMPAPRSDAAGQDVSVLLVEDEELVRAITAEQLRDLGFSVLEAPDGSAALKVLRSDSRVDMLVTDVGLPGGLNGRQVADAARERRPRLPVLFITGYAGSVLDKQLAPGMQIIGKPFALEALARRVKQMLDAPAENPPPAAAASPPANAVSAKAVSANAVSAEASPAGVPPAGPPSGR